MGDNSQLKLDSIVEHWLVLESAVTRGDHDARVFLEQTFGPWATEQMRLHSN